MHHVWIPIYAHVVRHRWLDLAIPLSKTYADAVFREASTGIP